MANRDNHYEAAFEAFLRWHCVPYVAVDETRRTLLPKGESLKSLDFILSPSGNPRRLLVDVKGRQFPAGQQKQYWRNWVTGEDLRSLSRWEKLFGCQFGSLLVFAYNVVGAVAPLPEEELFTFRDRLYGFVGISLQQYASCARQISPKWGTVAMPVGRFRQLALPVRAFLSRQPSTDYPTEPSEVAIKCT